MSHLEHQRLQDPQAGEPSAGGSPQPAPAANSKKPTHKPYIYIPFVCGEYDFVFLADPVKRLKAISLQTICSYRALGTGTCTARDMAFMFGIVSLKLPEKKDGTSSTPTPNTTSAPNATPASNATLTESMLSFSLDGHVFDFPTDPVRNLSAVRTQTIACYRALDARKSTPRDMAFMFSTVEKLKLIGGGLPEVASPESNPYREKEHIQGTPCEDSVREESNREGRGGSEDSGRIVVLIAGLGPGNPVIEDSEEGILEEQQVQMGTRNQVSSCTNATPSKRAHTEDHRHDRGGGRQGLPTGEGNKRRRLSHAEIPPAGGAYVISDGEDPDSDDEAPCDRDEGEPASGDELLCGENGRSRKSKKRALDLKFRWKPWQGKSVRDFPDFAAASRSTGRSENWVKGKYVAGYISLKGQFANSKKLEPKCDMCKGDESKPCKVLANPDVGPLNRVNCNHCLSLGKVCRLGGVDRRTIKAEEAEKADIIILD